MLTTHFERCGQTLLCIGTLIVIAVLTLFGSTIKTAVGSHVPQPPLDIRTLWQRPPDDGYLQFVTQPDVRRITALPATDPMPVDHIGTEEHTGWSDSRGYGYQDTTLGIAPAGGDNHAHAGDWVDFDWVQENPFDEGSFFDPTMVDPPANHWTLIGPGPPPVARTDEGLLGWQIGPPCDPPKFVCDEQHITDGRQHSHPSTTPVLTPKQRYSNSYIGFVDVFSIISMDGDFPPVSDGISRLVGQLDNESSRRDAALDYELWFVDLTNACSTHGIPVKVWEPGWTHVSDVDDFVARWKPAIPSGTASCGFGTATWNAVAIEPERMFHDEITEIDAVIALGLPCDFNKDGPCDCADIDALVAEIVAGIHDPMFDLTLDGLVNNSDLTAWLTEAGEFNLGSGRSYLPGDANLDGFVDISDFNIWNANKFTAATGWCSGDFTANGIVDVSDLNVWNGNRFQSSDGVTLVPEPASLRLLLAALAIPFWRYQTGTLGAGWRWRRSWQHKQVSVF